MAVIWLAVRIYVGWAWLEAGWHKIEAVGASNYIVDGAGILSFWKRIAAVPVAPAKPVITYDWYRGLIQFLIDNHAEVVMGKVIAFGEAAVGTALILASCSFSRGRRRVTSDWTGSYCRCSAHRGVLKTPTAKVGNRGSSGTRRRDGIRTSRCCPHSSSATIAERALSASATNAIRRSLTLLDIAFIGAPIPKNAARTQTATRGSSDVTRSMTFAASRVIMAAST